MSVEAVAWAKQQQTGSPARKAVLLVVAEHANYHEGEHDGYHCGYPGQKLIGDEAELSDRRARSHLAALEEMGLIRRVRRVSRHGHRNSDWIILPVRTVSGSDQYVRPDVSSGRPADETSGRAAYRTNPAIPTGRSEPSLPDAGVQVTMRRTMRENPVVPLSVGDLTTREEPAPDREPRPDPSSPPVPPPAPPARRKPPQAPRCPQPGHTHLARTGCPNCRADALEARTETPTTERSTKTDLFRAYFEKDPDQIARNSNGARTAMAGVVGGKARARGPDTRAAPGRTPPAGTPGPHDHATTRTARSTPTAGGTP